MLPPSCRSAWTAIVVILAFFVPLSSTAQGPGTVGAAVVAANSVLDKVEDVGTGLTGNAQIVVGTTAGQFAQLIAETEKAAGNNLATPLNNLGSNARLSVDRLMQVTEQLDRIANRQQACIFQNLDLFLAGLQTVTAGMKSGIPLINPGAPRLVSFIFDGKQTPNVVPREGGRARLKGFRLWENPSAPPEVSIMSNNAVIGTPAAQPGGGPDELAIAVTPDFVRNQAGKCLLVQVRTYRPKKFLFIFPAGKQLTGTLAIPMCVPQEYQRSLSLTANIAYSVTNQVEKTLSGRRFGWGNDKCEGGRSNVSQTMAWSADIPAGFRIVRVHQSDPDTRNDTNINVSFTNESVTAAGWLDEASCVEVCIPFGPCIRKLLHDTHWFKTLAPVIAGPNTVTTTAVGTGDPVQMQLPSTSMCVNVPKTGEASGASTVWVTIDQYAAGRKLPNPLHVGPRLTTPDMNTLQDTRQQDTYAIAVRYNPVAVNGNCQVCATVTSQVGCGW
jgi:hypothetical protein